MYMSSDLNQEETPVFNSRKRRLYLRIVCGRLYMGVDCKVIITVKGWKNTYLWETKYAPAVNHKKRNWS